VSDTKVFTYAGIPHNVNGPVSGTNLNGEGMPGNKIHFDDLADDRLLAVVLTLASEVWALRERFAVHEAIAARRGISLETEVENYEFPDGELERMAQLRRDFVGNLFRILDEHRGNGVGGGRKASRARQPARKAAAKRRRK
jgi:hypothetical protein